VLQPQLPVSAVELLLQQLQLPVLTADVPLQQPVFTATAPVDHGQAV